MTFGLNSRYTFEKFNELSKGDVYKRQQSNTTGNPSTTINREDESLNAMKFRELDIYYSSIADNIVVGEETNYNYADSRDLNKDNNLENEGINFGKIFNDVKDVITVSYTHLDVYKRQVFKRTSTPSDYYYINTKFFKIVQCFYYFQRGVIALDRGIL